MQIPFEGATRDSLALSMAYIKLFSEMRPRSVLASFSGHVAAVANLLGAAKHYYLRDLVRVRCLRKK